MPHRVAHPCTSQIQPWRKNRPPASLAKGPWPGKAEAFAIGRLRPFYGAALLALALASAAGAQPWAPSATFHGDGTAGSSNPAVTDTDAFATCP
jgi:hypothetical protein